MQETVNREFKKIKSLQFLYEVNEDGTIFRNVKSKKQSKIILDMHHSKSGYYVTFVNIKGKVKRVMIHNVVAECWLGSKPEGMEIDHIDRNSRNNHYTNLRYVNHSQQMKNRILSDRIIKTATENITKYRQSIQIHTKIINTKTKKEYEFESLEATARFLRAYYSIDNPRWFSKLLQKRRKHIRDFDIYYLNAETRHANSTE